MQPRYRALAALVSLSLAPFALHAAGNEYSISLKHAHLLPAPDVAKLQMEDGKAIGRPFRYGIQIPVDSFSLDAKGGDGGRWIAGKDGSERYLWTLASPGAKSLDFHFSRLQLPQGAKLLLRGEGADNLRVIEAHELSAKGGYHSPYLAGDRAEIEVWLPKGTRHLADVQLAAAMHGYRGLFELADPMEKSGSCNVDVACPAGDTWQNEIDSVGHYTFNQGGSGYVCTGTLMANTAQTTTPYFLTANHCLSSGSIASSVVVYWNYQSSTCRTPGSSASGSSLSRNISSHSQSGASLVAGYASSDFTLLQLNSAVPAGADAFFSGWDAGGATPSSAAGIHHPAGHEKRIAIEDQSLSISGYGGGSGSTHWRVNDWDQGTTEGGSSGSGLWNQNKRLVGQLHGGSAACGNNLSDYYGRLSVSWNGGGSSGNRLRDWLDSADTGATAMAGYRTGGGGPDPDPDPEPGDTVLTNGVAKTGLSASSGSMLMYTLVVPSGASNLSFAISGGTGDADLYVRRGSAPTTATYDCRPYLSGNNETCNIPSPVAGTYYVGVRAYSAFSGVSLVGSFTAGGGGGGASFFENTGNYTISDMQTVESPIAVSRSGNAPSDLEVDVRIIHTYKGDLIVNLVAPDGSTYLLHNGTGGGTDNVIGTYTVNASSESASGTWRLRVYDRYNGDTGYIDSWSLQF